MQIAPFTGIFGPVTVKVKTSGKDKFPGYHSALLGLPEARLEIMACL